MRIRGCLSLSGVAAIALSLSTGSCGGGSGNGTSTEGPQDASGGPDGTLESAHDGGSDGAGGDAPDIEAAGPDGSIEDAAITDAAGEDVTSRDASGVDAMPDASSEAEASATDARRPRRARRRRVVGGACTWTAGPSSNSGEITCYWLGQLPPEGAGCSSYKTYCGYCGTESGSNNGGVCPSGIVDSVPNTATAYFVAFPAGTFGQGKYCGMCAEVAYNGKSVTATVVDDCGAGTCSTANHLNLSLQAAVALGLGQNGTTGDATSGVTWKAVDCPVTGDIVAVYNNGYAGQLYFQNVVFPVAAATAGGHTATENLGSWDFGTSVAGTSLTLTDTLGHVVTGTVPGSSGGSTGVQFPLTCQ